MQFFIILYFSHTHLPNFHSIEHKCGYFFSGGLWLNLIGDGILQYILGASKVDFIKFPVSMSIHFKVI